MVVADRTRGVFDWITDNYASMIIALLPTALNAMVNSTHIRIVLHCLGVQFDAQLWTRLCQWEDHHGLLLLLNWWELWDWSHFTLDLGLPSIIHPTLLFFKCAGPCACLCLCAGACGGGIGHTHGGFLRPGYVFVTTDEPTDNLIREWRGVGGEEGGGEGGKVGGGWEEKIL